MAIRSHVTCVDDIEFLQLEKNGLPIHVLFCGEKGALIPALDIAVHAFPNYKRQDGCTRAPNIVRCFASYFEHIHALQALSKGQKLLREVYFTQQPCQKFPISMELCNYNDVQNLLNNRANKKASKKHNFDAIFKEYDKQVQIIGKITEILNRCNEKHGFKKAETVSAKEYEKLLKEVQYYRQYFTQTTKIRQQLGIVFPTQQIAL